MNMSFGVFSQYSCPVSSSTEQFQSINKLWMNVISTLSKLKAEQSVCTISSSFAQTAMPVVLINLAVCRRSGKSPWSFSLTYVSASQVSAQRFWRVGQFCSRRSHCLKASMQNGQYGTWWAHDVWVFGVCSQSHYHQLVLFREEVVCIPPVAVMMFLQPFSLLPLQSLPLQKKTSCCSCSSSPPPPPPPTSLPILCQSVTFLISWNTAVGWDSLDDCSFRWTVAVKLVIKQMCPSPSS